MAAIGGKYDPAAEPESRDVMPEHECTAHVVESDYKANRAGNGHLIALTWEILDGPHKSRRVWDNLNIDHPNKTARDIGNAQFAAIRVALFGSKDKVVNDTTELHKIPCQIKIGVQVNKDTKERSNVIKKYTNLASASAPAAPASAPPWAKAEDRF